MMFNAKEYPISSFLSEKILTIPRNQRNYVWSRTHWSDLLLDMQFIVDTNSETNHFLGSIVLQRGITANGLERFSVIDGQQRTVTMVLFICAAIKIFQEYNLEADLKGTRKNLIVTDRKDQEFVIISSEKHLLVQDIARSILDPNLTLDSLINSLNIPRGQENIVKALQYYYDSFKQLAEKKGPEYIVRLKDALLDSLFINITADTEADSYTVFEILNARGQNLEEYELLKNYIMRYIMPQDMVDEVKTKWADIERMLGVQMTNFFRHYVTHIVGKNNDQGVYRTLQKAYPKPDVSKLLNDLYYKAQRYAKICYPEQIEPANDVERQELRILSRYKARRSQQFRPLLLSLMCNHDKKKLSDKMYLDSIQFIYAFFVCFTIIGEERSNKLTDVIEKYAPLLESDFSDDLLSKCMESIKKKLPGEKTFRHRFMALGYSNHYDYYHDNKKKTQVLIALELIENHLAPDIEHRDNTIEHIKADANERENALIGNLTLLERHYNSVCKDLPLEDKIDVYRQSSFKMTRNVADRYAGKEFNPTERAEKLASMIYHDILHFA